MHGMFSYATAFNIDLSLWDVTKVTDMQDMFSGASSFKKSLHGEWSSSAADKDRMFRGSPGRIFLFRASNCKTTTSINTLNLTLTHCNPDSNPKPWALHKP